MQTPGQPQPLKVYQAAGATTTAQILSSPMKVATASGMQTVRIVNPAQAAVMKGSIPQGSNLKQIIVQKPGTVGGGNATGQQVFTVLKTGPGQVLTTVSFI